MTKTGVKATNEEFKHLIEIARNARNTPCIAMTLGEGLAGRDWASQAWSNAQQACHALALAHGLPEIQGYYGIDMNQEFVRT